jgi:UDP-N-acetylmuramate--alanine ligase
MTYVPPEGSIPTLPVPRLEDMRRIHMVGIGGAGMCGIARLLVARGAGVTGSDLRESGALVDLRALGAKVFVGHRAEQLDAGPPPDAVVVSTAIGDDNPEVVEARRRGIPVLARAQVLAALTSAQRTIAVSGTHGKTTTTSMLAVVLERAGVDPTFVIGGDLNESGSGARHGAGGWFVAEADESDGSFLLLDPEVAVVTNVEDDHLDFYRDSADILDAFAAFFGRANRIVACGDDPGVREALVLAGREAITYGIEEVNSVRVVVEEVQGPGARGSVEIEGTRVDLELRQAGAHNLLNASAAIVAASLAGVDPSRAVEALRGFTGVRRRYEFRGMARGAEFVDDYAHHPTEVSATLGAVSPHYDRVLVVFQPHRFTRTREMWRSLGESLRSADVVVVTDVYAAGEKPVPGVTGKLVVDSIAELAPGKRVVYLPRRVDLPRFLANEARAGDLVLTLGAGDVTMVADETLQRLREGA